MPALGRITESRGGRAFHRYRQLELEYSALRVVGRGLFLAVMLMLALLAVFAQVTDLLSGQNEVLIPTASVDPNVDLGKIVRGAFTRTSGAVFSIIGVLTLVVSSYLTARALRTGTRRALIGASAIKAGWTDRGNFVVAIFVPVLVLTTWLLCLATTIRRAAWSQLLGNQLPDLLVNSAKVGCILLEIVLVAGAAILAYRSTMGIWPRPPAAAALGILALVVVGGNFFLLYTYVGALLNTQVSAGIVLIITLLLWVNIVARAYLGALCWIAEPPSSARS